MSSRGAVPGVLFFLSSRDLTTVLGVLDSVSSRGAVPGVPSVVIPAQAGIHCTAGFTSGICICHPVARFPVFFSLCHPVARGPRKNECFCGVLFDPGIQVNQTSVRQHRQY